jgi:transcriptional regulator with XRE-family HTH domain
MNKSNVSEVLRIIRLLNKTNQTTMAKELGVKKQYIGAIENNTRESLTLKTIQVYSDYFNVKMSTILLLAEKLQDNPNYIKEMFYKYILYEENKINE